MKISVIICAHNPREAYLRRVIGALKAQVFNRADWEVLLIDNASSSPLSDSYDLGRLPFARVTREEKLGLTAARLCGIREARGELLVFVDDDNVLSSDYLLNAWRIAMEKPFLGAWGGSVLPDWEVSAPEWTRPYWPMLALREVTRDVLSTHHRSAHPCGAGMCVRRSVALAYANHVTRSPLSRRLDRRGASLASGGDVELAFTALDLGLSTGMFHSLKVTHIIPAARLRPDYLVNLAGEMAWSAAILEHLHNLPTIYRPRWPWRWAREVCLYTMFFSRRRAFHLARRSGERRARSEIARALARG